LLYYLFFFFSNIPSRGWLGSLLAAAWTAILNRSKPVRGP
jgi:hypothetical protein